VEVKTEQLVKGNSDKELLPTLALIHFCPKIAAGDD